MPSTLPEDSLQCPTTATGKVPMAKPDKSADSRILEVGWLMDKVNAALIWGKPKVIDLPSLEDASAKAVTMCPAVLQHEARLYEIPCPIDAKFSIQTDNSGRVGFRNELGQSKPDQCRFSAKHDRGRTAGPVAAPQTTGNPDSYPLSLHRR